jgi:hypothetical protein
MFRSDPVSNRLVSVRTALQCLVPVFILKYMHRTGCHLLSYRKGNEDVATVLLANTRDPEIRRLVP